MNQQQIEIREQQKASWDKFSPGWKKWDVFTMDFLKPMGDEIISMIKPAPGQQVLDIATGTGEPGLTIASMIGNGKVTATDVSPRMIELAMENAKAKGLDNFDAIVADVCDLPFPDNKFDSISCRMGFMFFPDMQLAAEEMYRVLKPGGQMATSVWDGPENNEWITLITGTLKAHLDLPAPPAGAPGMFRCAPPGTMAGILEKAGFTSVTEKKISGKINYDNANHYWDLMNEVAAPVVAALEKADEQTRKKIKEDVFKTIEKKYGRSTISLPYQAIVLCGKKK